MLIKNKNPNNENVIINLKCCVSIEKGISETTDISYYVINFYSSNSKVTILWVFNSEKERDKCYENILFYAKEV